MPSVASGAASLTMYDTLGDCGLSYPARPRTGGMDSPAILFITAIVFMCGVEGGIPLAKEATCLFCGEYPGF